MCWLEKSQSKASQLLGTEQLEKPGCAVEQTGGIDTLHLPVMHRADSEGSVSLECI